MALLDLISGGVSLLGGLFGSKKKDPTPASNIMSQAAGVRDAAKQYGFNPLTLLQYGQPGGALGGGGAAPLASTDLILGAVRDVADVLTGDADRRRAAAQLELDLGRVKLDQLRGAVLGVAPSAAGAVGSGSPALGRRAATVVAQPYVNPRLGMAENAMAPGRAKDVQPVSNGSGVTELENRLTGGPVSIPGDSGEPWGLDEVGTAFLFGAPQVAWNWSKLGFQHVFKPMPWLPKDGGGARGISNGFGVVPPRF